MNGKSFIGVFIVVILSVILSAAFAQAVPVTIESVEINGDPISMQDPNRLDLVRGQNLDVKVRLNAVSNGSNVEVHAFISGFEYNRDQPISDVTPVFDVDSGVTYVKRLQLRLSELVDEDNYLLRIIVSDRSGAELVQSYKIKIDVPRHNLVLKDLVLNPDTSVVAGRALLATVRVKNTGERDQEGIKIRVSIPDLQVSATDFIDNLDADESTTSEELYLRIPACAKAGTYDVRAAVEFNEGFDVITTTKKIDVVESESCPGAAAVKDKTMIIVSSESQNVVAGQAGAVYPITISNAGSSPRVYTLVVDGVDEWGSVRISPSNVVVLNPGEAKTVSMFVSAKQDASAGDRTFSVTVKDQAGNVLQQVMLRANVQSGETAPVVGGGLRRYLEIGLIVLVVLLIVVALIVAFSRMKGKEEEESETKTYY